MNVTRKTGNIFLTNIHRVYSGGDVEPSAEDEDTMDYFLGQRPTGATTDSKVDLGDIVRDIDEMVVLNDEAHHIHSDKLAWFKSIEDIHNRLKHKDKFLSLQVDVTATPKHNNGAIFVQTVSDYPLVEAISQNVVKHPVLPDSASRAKLSERQSSKYTEKYADYLALGYEEWRKAYKEHEKLGEKAILFVMTDDTKNCDIVGLRAYSSKSNILPEQTLGRGLRKMYPGDGVEEYVSVVGTDAFMDFVESIKAEGVELERKAMGEGTKPKTPIIVEIDNENTNKDIESLDIKIPVLTTRIYREYKNLADLDINNFGHKKVVYQTFSEKEQREIVFRDITTNEISHTTILNNIGVADYRSVAGYFSRTIMRDLKLVSGYDVLYGKVKSFMRNHLFDRQIELETPNTLRNLSEIETTKTLIDTFKKQINALTVQDRGDAEIRDYIKLLKTRPFVAKEQGYLIPKKSVFNKIIGDSRLELNFAAFLEECDDIVSYVKNYLAVHFKIDYVNANGDISNYYPDFIVKRSDKEHYIIETKGLENLDVPLKMERLKQWCVDINKAQSAVKYDYVFVDEESFSKYKPKSFRELLASFREYKE